MNINLPCECDAEEHVVDTHPEMCFGRLGLHYPAEGDPLPCGRLLTEKDIDYIFDAIEHADDD